MEPSVGSPVSTSTGGASPFSSPRTVGSGEQRCVRNDGKGWQCSQLAEPGHKHCARHRSKGSASAPAPKRVIKAGQVPTVRRSRPTPKPTPLYHHNRPASNNKMEEKPLLPGGFKCMKSRWISEYEKEQKAKEQAQQQQQQQQSIRLGGPQAPAHMELPAQSISTVEGKQQSQPTQAERKQPPAKWNAAAEAAVMQTASQRAVQPVQDSHGGSEVAAALPTAVEPPVKRRKVANIKAAIKVKGATTAQASATAPSLHKELPAAAKGPPASTSSAQPQSAAPSPSPAPHHLQLSHTEPLAGASLASTPPATAVRTARQTLLSVNRGDSGGPSAEPSGADACGLVPAEPTPVAGISPTSTAVHPAPPAERHTSASGAQHGRVGALHASHTAGSHRDDSHPSSLTITPPSSGAPASTHTQAAKSKHTGRAASAGAARTSAGPASVTQTVAFAAPLKPSRALPDTGGSSHVGEAASTLSHDGNPSARGGQAASPGVSPQPSNIAPQQQKQVRAQSSALASPPTGPAAATEAADRCGAGLETVAADSSARPSPGEAAAVTSPAGDTLESHAGKASSPASVGRQGAAEGRLEAASSIAASAAAALHQHAQPSTLPPVGGVAAEGEAQDKAEALVAVEFVSDGAARPLGKLDLAKIGTYSELWAAIRAAYASRLPDDSSAMKLGYRDADGDLLLLHPDEPFGNFVSAARCVMLTSLLQRLMAAAQAMSGRLWGSYCRALDTRPLLTKSLTSFTGFIAGDALAQWSTRRPGQAYDFKRTARFAAYGFLIHAPSTHYFYKALDKFVWPHSKLSTATILTKTAIDQLLWTPPISCVFYAAIKLMEGHPEQIVPTIKEKLWPTLKAGYTLWPLAHLVNFRFVPSHQRVLYVNCVAVGWNVILCRIASQGATTDHVAELKV